MQVHSYQADFGLRSQQCRTLAVRCVRNSVWSPNVHTEILLTWCHGKSRAIVHSTTLWLQKILLYYFLFFLHLIVFSFLSPSLSHTHTIPLALYGMVYVHC